jgi:dipeptidyl aminopeptidase/acylaminoacyl peptidase
LIDLTAIPPRVQALLPERVRYGLWVLEEWVDDETIGFYSEETGFGNFFTCHVETREIRQVSDFTEEVSDMVLLNVGARRMLAAVISRPHESILVVLDAETGAELGRRTFDSDVFIRDSDNTHVALVTTSLETPFQLIEVQVSPMSDVEVVIAVDLQAEVPAALRESINACEIERVEIPTFDEDPQTGETRLLHAFLLTPRVALPKSQQLARIESFYGGGNTFDAESQMLCEAGMTTLSPSPRGSWGFGAEFSALNDGDLGGDEIVDIIYAGRWLEERLEIDASQIGVYGASHGGYATMRLLTFPPETNDRNVSFDWGFGMSHAGFSNILTFYESSNTPDWVRLEAGDPTIEHERLRDRSPVSHTDLLNAPILLTHGENDPRVPVQESRQFVRAARETSPNLLTYVEFGGQGHGIAGFDNKLRYYQIVFSFLEGVVRRNESDASD